METLEKLDSSEPYSDIRKVINRKPFLRTLYLEFYSHFLDAIKDCPKDGKILEIGSGAGFLKEYLPQLITSDILPYEGVDMVVDATCIPFPDESLSALLMLNVLHHISDSERLFEESIRTLKRGGKLVILDQYPGWIGKPILKYFHHEPFDSSRESWGFPTNGPLSGANGALAWIKFFRDRKRFEDKYTILKVNKCNTHTSLRYWLSGGLKNWSLLPNSLFEMATTLDRILLRISPEFGSFLSVEIEKR